MSLFQRKDFISHSGVPLTWKLECDALGYQDWNCLAYLVASKYSFFNVIGIPQGGLDFANALKPYINPEGEYFLIVDDVLTTGGSFRTILETNEQAKEHKLKALGIVVFDRSGGGLQAPHWDWVRTMFAVQPWLL